MKYSTLLALANAIKINDQETCSSTPQAYLVQNGLQREALAQVEAEVSEQFHFDPVTGLPTGADKLSADMLQMANTLGIAAAGTNWGTNPSPMTPGDDLNIYAFLTTIYTQNVAIKGFLDAQALEVADVLTAISDLKLEFNTNLLETESYIVRKITGIGASLTKLEYTTLSTDVSAVASFAEFNLALEKTTLNEALWDGDKVIVRSDTILTNL